MCLTMSGLVTVSTINSLISLSPYPGRSRWVEFPASVGMDYDGSQIPAEW